MHDNEQLLTKLTKALVVAIETYNIDLIDVLSKAYQRVVSVQKYKGITWKNTKNV